MNVFRTLFIGVVIGMVNVIPGVSGSTMAVAFNIYDRFVNVFTFNLKKLIADWKFVLPLILGMACGVLIFSKLITVLYTKFPVPTNFFFTGLIIGTIPLLIGFMKKTEDGKKMGVGRKISIAVCALAGIAILLVFAFLGGGLDTEANYSGALPVFTWGLALRIFIAGIFGAVAMIIPGISGSLIMLIMGVYPIVMNSISQFFSSEVLHSLTLLLPNGFGVIIGLISGAYLVKYLLRVAPNNTYALIFGLLVGSAIQICPLTSNIFAGKALSLSATFTGVGMTIACIICLAAGILMAYYSSKISPEESEKKEELPSKEENK